MGDTGGTCKVTPCYTDRNAVCEDGKCMCVNDTYSTTTWCSSVDDMMGCQLRSFQAGVCRKTCQRDTIITCATSATWCGDNSDCISVKEKGYSSWLSAGYYCKCKAGTCATDTGTCVQMSGGDTTLASMQSPQPWPAVSLPLMLLSA